MNQRTGKAGGLQELESIGLRVPKYKVLRGEESRTRLQDADWQQFLNAGIPQFAVRSSYRGEDGQEDSYAGIFQSFLEIPKKDLLETIEKVRASASSKQAKAYAKRRGLPTPKGEKMDVIVQKMIPSDISGIVFSHNPRGLLHEAIIEIAYGSGDDLIAGNSPTNRYVYHKDQNSLHYSTREDAPLLSKKVQEELLNFIDTWAEKRTFDVEFAIHNDELHFLQIRPITNLDFSNPIILDNSNISESYPGVTLPLSIDFAKLAYKGVFQQLGRRVLGENIIHEPTWPLLAEMVEDYEGHMYYKISNWYQVLNYLPFSKKIITIWQKMLGVKNTCVPANLYQPSWIKKLAFFPRFVKLFLRTPKKMEALDAEFQRIETLYHDKIKQENTPRAWREIFYLLKERILEHWDITLINDLYAFLFTGLLTEKDQKQLTANNALASMEPLHEMEKLSRMEEGLALEEAKQKFIQRYGDRTIEELKLETKTFRSHPKLLDEAIGSYRGASNSERHKDAYEQKGFFTKIWFKQAVKGVAHRETSRLNRTRIYGIVRELAWKFAHNFVDMGVIEEPEDIFYLHLDEMLTEQPTDYKERVEERKREYEVYKTLPTFSRLVFAGTLVPSGHEELVTSQNAEYQHTYLGTPVSSGVVEGEAIVITSPEAIDVEKIKGKILVAPLTDPAWAYLMVHAKAFVIEKGSMLSHTGIIARELGIPCVTGVKNASTVFATGEWLHVNGDTGVVTRKGGEYDSR